MTGGNPPVCSGSSEERTRAMGSIEAQIAQLLAEIDDGYLQLGKQMSEISELENASINEKVDRVVALKQQLRELRTSAESEENLNGKNESADDD